MAMLNQMDLSTVMPNVWESALISNITLNIGSISFFLMEKAIASGSVPPVVFYYWNWANYLNAQYGSKIVAAYFAIKSFLQDDKSLFDYTRVLVYAF